MNKHFSVRYQHDYEAAVIDATGRLTHGEADCQLRDLMQDLLGRGYRRLLMNLSGATYLDSSALGALIAAQRGAQDAGGELKLVNLSPRASDLLQLTKLYVVFAVYKDEQSALASFGPKPTPPRIPPSLPHAA